MIEERVKKYRCSEKFHPYLVQVFNRLPQEVLEEEILGDVWLEIISINPANYGKSLRLSKPATHLIILNEAILDMEEHEIVHTIAHEIGHKVAMGGKSGLWEKEAEDLVKAWGFEEESAAVTYELAMLESEGYQLGYQWAANQTDLDGFEEFFEEWICDSLTSDRRGQLLQLVDALGVIEDFRNRLFLYLVLDDKHVFRTAAAYGVMSFLRDKTTQSETDLGENSEESKQKGIYCQCEWCGRDIKYGNATLSVDRNIEHVDWNSERGCHAITVIHGQNLLTLCAACANLLDLGAVIETLNSSRLPDLRKLPSSVQG